MKEFIITKNKTNEYFKVSYSLIKFNKDLTSNKKKNLFFLDSKFYQLSR